FQAEDGIRYRTVTGVQTCALPIFIKDHSLQGFAAGLTLRAMDMIGNARYGVSLPYNYWPPAQWEEAAQTLQLRTDKKLTDLKLRSEERRVGKECKNGYVEEDVKSE